MRPGFDSRTTQCLFLLNLFPFFLFSRAAKKKRGNCLLHPGMLKTKIKVVHHKIQIAQAEGSPPWGGENGRLRGGLCYFRPARAVARPKNGGGKSIAVCRIRTCEGDPNCFRGNRRNHLAKTAPYQKRDFRAKLFSHSLFRVWREQRAVKKKEHSFAICCNTSMARWPSGLRRYVQVVVRKGVGSNPTLVSFFLSFFARCARKAELSAQCPERKTSI